MAEWRVDKNRRNLFGKFYVYLILLFTVLSCNHNFLVTGNPLAKFFGQTAGQTTLYGPDDKVVVLNITNIKQTIFNSEKAWFVEFFSSWCGHCIQFAPRWKKFAEDLQEWRDIVNIAGIDCAQDENTPSCREFEIMGYPTLRIFGPHAPELIASEASPAEKAHNKNITQVLNKGDGVLKAESMEKLKKNLMEKLEQYFPKLLALSKMSGLSQTELWESDEIYHQTKPSFLLLIYESDYSTVGLEVVLRLSGIKFIKVYRFSKLNNLYTQLKLDGWPAAGYLSSDGTSGPIVLGHDENLIDFLCKTVRRLVGVPQLQSSDAMIPNIVRDPHSIQRPPSDDHDVVSMDDLLHAIRDSLHKEIGLVQLIDGERFSALRDYLDILQKLFPSDNRETSVFLAKLTEWVSSNQNGQIESSAFMEKLQQLESELQPWNRGMDQFQKSFVIIRVDLNSWDECRGSVPGRRGYTCGLWRLFHTLTITGVQKSANEKVLTAILGYVNAFFGCEECKTHFSSMARRDGMYGTLNTESIIGQSLWLWKAHNEVNLRLKGTLSEDPAYPKQLYPNKRQCPECSIEGSSNMDERKVLEYLVRVYSQPRRHQAEAKREDTEDVNLVVNNGQQSYMSAVSVKLMSADTNKVKSQQQTSRLGLFSNTDIGLLLIVYLSVACLLLLGYVHFKMGRRRLEPLFLFRKICSSRSRFIV